MKQLIKIKTQFLKIDDYVFNVRTRKLNQIKSIEIIGNLIDIEYHHEEEHIFLETNDDVYILINLDKI